MVGLLGFYEFKQMWARSPYKNASNVLNRYIEENEIRTDVYDIKIVYVSQVDYKTKYQALASVTGRIIDGNKYYKNSFSWLSDLKTRQLPNYIFD